MSVCKESPLESPADDNIDNDEVGENSTEEKQMTQQKSSPQKGADLSRSHPWNLQWVIHIKIKMSQAHQIPMYLILMMYKYTNSPLKESQMVRI